MAMEGMKLASDLGAARGGKLLEAAVSGGQF